MGVEGGGRRGSQYGKQCPKALAARRKDWFPRGMGTGVLSVEKRYTHTRRQTHTYTTHR